MGGKQERENGTCLQPELSDLFFLFVNGDLSPEAQARIEDHLAECPKCREDVLFFLELQKAGRDLVEKK